MKLWQFEDRKQPYLVIFHNFVETESNNL